jgi:hypothetical protein
MIPATAFLVSRLRVPGCRLCVDAAALNTAITATRLPNSFALLFRRVDSKVISLVPHLYRQSARCGKRISIGIPILQVGVYPCRTVYLYCPH